MTGAKCSCVKGGFDFTITPIDCENFLFTDFSQWMKEDGYVIPEYYEVEVSPMSGGPLSFVKVVPESTSKVSSDDLGFSGKCIPDGIYCFKLGSDKGGCGHTYNKTVAITCSAQCSIDYLVSIAKDPKDFETVRKLREWVNAIEVNSRLGKEKKASEFFDILRTELSRLDCDCSTPKQEKNK